MSEDNALVEELIYDDDLLKSIDGTDFAPIDPDKEVKSLIFCLNTVEHDIERCLTEIQTNDNKITIDDFFDVDLWLAQETLNSIYTHSAEVQQWIETELWRGDVSRFQPDFSSYMLNASTMFAEMVDVLAGKEKKEEKTMLEQILEDFYRDDDDESNKKPSMKERLEQFLEEIRHIKQLFIDCVQGVSSKA